MGRTLYTMLECLSVPFPRYHELEYVQIKGFSLPLVLPSDGGPSGILATIPCIPIQKLTLFPMGKVQASVTD